MHYIEDIEFGGKKILIRAGYDVPVEDGKVVEDERIKESLLTLDQICKQDPKLIVIVSHLGRPDGKTNPEFSNQPVAEKLKDLSGKDVVLIKTLEELAQLAEKADEKKSDPNIYMLENIRFWKEEEEGDEEFARKVAENFHVYVNDAFSVSHRDHASISKMPDFVAEKCAGALFAEEYTNLQKVKDAPEHPAVAIIGGAKIETKLPVIQNLAESYDKVLVGGKIANEAVDEKIELGEKVLLPIDFAPQGLESERLDIGPKTVESYIKEIALAKTIVWNGPMGKFEDEKCEEGTKKIMGAIVDNEEAHTVIGGGETVEAVKRLVRQPADLKKFDYVSMSGGAMLEFMAGKELPGVEALERFASL